MKYFFMRFQLVFVSIILLITFALMMGIVTRYNVRWDMTQDKLYSLSEQTEKLLKQLKDQPIHVMAFYPQDDSVRKAFEVYLKQCRLKHPNFRYDFYDPDRVPSLAKKYDVRELYTVIIDYAGHQEKIQNPTEELITNALLRLANPKRFDICFVSGHGEASSYSEERNGLSLFRKSIEANNYMTHDVVLQEGNTPEECQVFVIAGPRRDFAGDEFEALERTFRQGRSIFFLIDPMDPGAGQSFVLFLNRFGIALGENVIVDKVSRMVGGDYLVPLVSQYIAQHPVTNKFTQPTFYPVARQITPASDEFKDLEVTPLALTGSGSWAETDLPSLEEGKAVFEAESDLPGPISLAVSVEELSLQDQAAARERTDERPAGGRIIAVGDSDFITNAYLELAGNGAFAINSIQWLAKDDRFISIHTKQPEFVPLFIPKEKRLALLSVFFGMPLGLLMFGGVRIHSRRRSV